MANGRILFMSIQTTELYLASEVSQGDYKAYAIGEQLLSHDLSHETWGGNGEQGDLEELAAAVTWLWACYRTRADKVISVPRAITLADDPETEIEEGDLPFVIDLDDLLWRTEYSLLVHGFSYWMKLSSKKKGMRFDSIENVDGKFRMKLAESTITDLAKVRWLDPLSITPRVNEGDGLYEFKRELKNDKKTYPVNQETGYFDDIVYFWLPGMREAAPGFGTSTVVEAPSAVLRNIDIYADNFFKQGGMPITLLTVPKNTKDDQRRALEKRFTRFATAVKNAFRPVAVKGDVQVQRLGLNPGEVGMPALEDSKRDSILAAAGVPLSVLIGRASNYATAKQDSKNLIQNVIQPRCRILEAVVNRQLLEPQGYKLRFRVDTVPEMKQDEREAARAVKDLSAAGVTPEAALYFLGYDLALPEGVELTRAVEPEPDTEEPQGGDDLRSLVDADIAKWQKKSMRAFRRGEPAGVPFRSDYIADAEHGRIEKALATATTEQEVRAAFVARPFRRHQTLEDYP